MQPSAQSAPIRLRSTPAALGVLLALGLATSARAVPSTPPQQSPVSAAILASRDVTFVWWGTGSWFGLQVQYFDTTTSSWKGYKAQDHISGISSETSTPSPT